MRIVSLLVLILGLSACWEDPDYVEPPEQQTTPPVAASESEEPKFDPAIEASQIARNEVPDSIIGSWGADTMGGPACHPDSSNLMVLSRDSMTIGDAVAPVKKVEKELSEIFVTVDDVQDGKPVEITYRFDAEKNVMSKEREIDGTPWFAPPRFRCR